MSASDITPAASAGQAVIVSAPSGAGKTSLVAALLETLPGLEVSVSHTTRAPREGEVHGRHYWFVDRAAFEAEIAAGNMLEHADVFGNLYGTSRRFVEGRLAAGADVLLEIDWQGARLARAQLPGCVSIMILPPSREALAERLRARGKDSEATIARRLAEARAEMSRVHEFDYVLINDDFANALAELRAIVVAERCRAARRLQRDAAVLRELLASD